MTLYVTNCTFIYQIKAKCMTFTIKFILSSYFEYFSFYKQNAEGTPCERNWQNFSSIFFAIFFSQAYLFNKSIAIIHI